MHKHVIILYPHVFVFNNKLLFVNFRDGRVVGERHRQHLDL